jgi:hypothetical protein
MAVVLVTSTSTPRTCQTHVPGVQFVLGVHVEQCVPNTRESPRVLGARGTSPADTAVAKLLNTPNLATLTSSQHNR